MKKAMFSLLLLSLAAFTTPDAKPASAPQSKTFTVPTHKTDPNITEIDFVPNSGYPFEAHALLDGTTTREVQYYVHIVYYTNPYFTTTYSMDYCLFDVNSGHNDGWYRNASSGLPTCYGIASWYVQLTL
jgi:hypothetical protein